ncbi:MAG TPA: hypothetical protein VED59_07505 [Acidimicrobiales bacterium]|nr:hypothetical protein [Acidimicrobiales bacterium]
MRRATWLGIGLITGAAASKWVECKARRRLKAGTRIAGRAKSVAAGKLEDVRSALEEGYRGMSQKEGELRGRLQTWRARVGPVARGPDQ